ncbi:halocyanin domain-containing protein [Halorhabdus sp. CBA1104]|uniref:halocyanin domain-containing protein n=1 Tax=Halorhabdus sp. CBA1104 TaxID=1380432 RepID=UPI0012B1EE87|nr:halocyanin domain-containing protein [Halorhabdus sp. CBA1104]QGN06649.1 halocyanin domain-containing protein [Halorhabdus sp. CBA1104]
MHRREFLRSAGTVAGGTAAAGAAGSAAAAEDGDGGGGGGGQPDYGGWLSDVGNFSATEDYRGQDEVTVEVGVEGNGDYWAFGPPAMYVDTGTTVIWEWTGQGGGHNVVGENDDYSSGPSTGEAGTTFERTFDEAGIHKYYCDPHLSVGMKGAVVVGDDYPSVSAGASTPVNPEHMGVPIQAHYVGIATVLGISASLAFTFYLLKYGETPHSKGGSD